MDLSAWEKKRVTLNWEGTNLSFHVAQDLFSSHEIDQGTKLLLRSLDLAALPPRPVVLDFGCGYGPLGLALKARFPSARVVLIDRDALAVEFAAWNARDIAVGYDTSEVVVHGGLDFGSPYAPDGYDGILWNVPGKAGEAVLRGLIADVPHALKPDGLIALVVVNPLAAMVRDAIGVYQDLEVTHEGRHTAHTVLHARRGAVGMRTWPRPSAFERGVFDRLPETLAQSGLPYKRQPVIGLPEFDAPDFTSAAIMEMLQTSEWRSRGIALLLMEGIGQGHTTLLAAQTLVPKSIALVDRDLLALNATERNLAANGLPGSVIHSEHAPSLASSRIERVGADLIVVRLEAQLSPARLAAEHGEILAALVPGGTLIVGGPSTSVSRFLRVANKGNAVRERSRTRGKGASAAMLTYG